jgi:PE family
MQPMSHNPAVAGIGEQVVASGAEGQAVGATAAGSVTGLPPAGADEVSAEAAAAFDAEAAQLLALNAAAQEELTRTGAKLTEIADIYSAVDDDAAGTLA